MPKILDKLVPLAQRFANLDNLLSRIVPVPVEWLKGESTGNYLGSSNVMDCLPCDNYRDMISAWRKALRWTDGLDNALSVMLASITSTKIVGDQLWIKVLGPASCGKSTLCEAVSVNNQYVLAKSTMRGFHSGYKSPDGVDYSLIAQAGGKTLVTKDGDTLLQSPNLSQILSEGRDIYDGVSRTHYRNAESNDYTGIRMTWLLCGTSSLRSIDSSELGERFLDCVVMEGIDDLEEDEILWRVANRTDRNMSVEADGKPETQYEPELAYAMRLTGGYVGYLRDNAPDLLSVVEIPEPLLRKCTRLAKFIAYMRARPSRFQDEEAEREVSYRLVSQLTRLAKCLAVVLNCSLVDEEVMRRVVKVTMDTSRGQTLNIIKYLYKAPVGMEAAGLSLLLNRTEDKVRTMLRFLRQIGAVHLNVVKAPSGARTNSKRWRLTDKMRILYEEVTVDQS